MSAQKGVQKTLADDDYGIEESDLDGDEWRELHRRFRGDEEKIAAHVGIDTRLVRRLLNEADVYELESPEPHHVRAALPHEAGCSPLNCGRCGEPEIWEHPCPTCGFDPRPESHEPDGTMCDGCGRREATFSTWGEHYCDDCHQQGEREYQMPLTGERWLVTRWRERDDGRIVVFEREVIDDD